MPRTPITTNYSVRPSITWEVMAIIQTWFWDDLQVWEDWKYWVDTWWTSFSTIYTTRTPITTNYT